MRNIALLAFRLTLGGYLAGHGAQTLFGSFGGPGLEAAGARFERLGLTLGRTMAALAGASELGGGLLTAAALAYPIGPLAIIGTMAVAGFTAHRGKGAFLATGGPELTLIDLTAAAVLATAGPGPYSADRLLRLRIPRSLVRLAVLGVAATVAYAATRSVAKSGRRDAGTALLPTVDDHGASDQGAGFRA